ncbi:hypothetical protein B0H16DRAFT_1641051 [Mycena metata]|uniref:Uncharacterized protein n=1 Tax=Mycena metata TaxID=1033252 RepID=A0AAD7DZ24_9AGAR|nr:hypothetical protein B0H16DRAFT_1641051 [Mycena metata]
MPGIPDAAITTLASSIPPTMAANATLVIIGLILVAASLQYTSPTRLTRILSTAMNSLENVYTDAVYSGLLSVLPADEVDIVVSTYVTLWQSSRAATQGRKAPGRNPAQLQVVARNHMRVFQGPSTRLVPLHQ